MTLPKSKFAGKITFNNNLALVCYQEALTPFRP